jgi:uncharacterized protein
VNDRISDIDAVRGFALFGILVVNIMAFSSVYYGTGLTPPYEFTTLDNLLAFIILTFFELKFYLLFSFLFGYSITLQIQSAEKAGSAFLPRIIRRQTGLFVIGALHALILFHGDILTTYAILGLLLVAIRRVSNNAKLLLAFTLMLSTAAFWIAMAWLQESHTADNAAYSHSIADAALIAWRGDPVMIIHQHILGLTDFLPLLLLLQAPCAFAMFLVGFVAGQRRLFSLYKTHAPTFDKLFIWGVAIGLPGGILYAVATQSMAGTPIETAAMALAILTSPFLSLAMLIGMVKLFNMNGSQHLRNWFADLGRMALSNYLLQSLVCALIFHGYGLGLVERLSLSQVFGVAVLIFSAQLLFSRWWMSHFRYGPLEWLLRALTICRWPTR